MEQLCQNLSPQYDQVLTHVLLFSPRRRRIAEIDVLGIKGEYCDAYEVKCSYRPTKARKQLRRIRKVLSPLRQVKNTFFYCGDTGIMENILDNQ
ncbi:hypothetical protein HYX13_03490 [Candidatus Woesearchaeota archaeon]|nr:hypothetical protein [Candidatus Woesearchaeota archaeon]